jgi:hypothetical protein
MPRRAALKTNRSGLTPRERHVRICQCARAIQQKVEYSALMKRGYGKEEITEARKMLGLNPVKGDGNPQTNQNTGRAEKKQPNEQIHAHGNPL